MDPRKNYDWDRIVDLTHTLASGMPIYPGDPVPSFQPYSTIEKNGVKLTKMQLGSHTGTHMDSPAHFILGGISIDRIPVSEFISEAIVVDLSSKPIGSGITSDDLKSKIDGIVKEGDIVLCYTGCSEKWGDPQLNSNFTYLAESGAQYLVSKKVRGFGIDFLSVEKFHAVSAVAHKTLLGAGMFLIESLNSNLKQLVGTRILFISLPIKLENGDGAPCRSIAIPILE